MALISVHEILNDPDFTDHFKVVRRKEIINNFGESKVITSVYPQVIGVVTVSDNELHRDQKFDITAFAISVISNFPLRGESIFNGQSFKPDVVQWRGSNFVVMSINPYPQFGPGFYETICHSIEAVDGVFLPDDNPPQLAFNTPVNSGYIPLMRLF